MNQVLPIVRDAVHTLWRHKRLWVLGFLVAAGASGSGQVELPAGGVATIPGWATELLVAAFALGLVVLALHVVAEGALIDAVRDERRGKTPRVGASWRRGVGTAGRMLGLKLLSAGTCGALILLAAAPALLGLLDVVPLALGMLVTLPLALVAVPTVISLYLATEIGARMVVFEQRGSLDALRAGLRFLRGRLRLALTLFVVDGASQLVIALVALPFALVVLAFASGLYALAGLGPAVVVGALLAAPIGALSVGARGTFRSALWTHAFLDERPAAS